MASDRLGGSRLWPEVPTETLKHGPVWPRPWRWGSPGQCLPVSWPPPPPQAPVPAQRGLRASWHPGLCFLSCDAPWGYQELKEEGPLRCFSTNKGQEELCPGSWLSWAIPGLGRDPATPPRPVYSVLLSRARLTTPSKRDLLLNTVLSNRVHQKAGFCSFGDRGNVCVSCNLTTPGSGATQPNPRTERKKQQQKPVTFL